MDLWVGHRFGRSLLFGLGLRELDRVLIPPGQRMPRHTIPRPGFAAPAAWPTTPTARITHQPKVHREWSSALLPRASSDSVGSGNRALGVGRPAARASAEALKGGVDVGAVRR